ncbi:MULTISPECIES: TIGR04141 family sporadically distributed protein [unclassified Herbaspirillum]|uniref:TIGR04141 family sporadically distributed protein n=1 Tax=unclassified Herbaspirillum TaxID=2624150 RepID=UPI000E2ED822|nr:MULTISPECIES: TIGR04141 family sporadically distributed protein [unclassified Herbaspirillum]RFB70831.1 sporadically distributed protein, TIGR04141 family [Herbaspirillum sp. 3R-3a1]TFI08645.1 sporadically distributed protein, TIGR04141 family [Herbaspirillum sp. 3R11]TFI15059.1 sporadically distributed protein, TIGR04141 family [Herbaspirillum sp. 3R-11]TFI29751.1 sporadically distributed protein, TIGR04141 family [Herbaspirillum sp. 3C11]
MQEVLRRKEKLSIYLAKSSSSSDEKLIKLENAKNPVALQIKEGSATLYVKLDVPSKVPEWSQLLTANQDIPDGLFGKKSSVGAALIVRVHGRVFLLSFGTGYHLLRGDGIERDFGLRVTLNSVDPDKLRSLDKASYDSNPLNSRTQSTKDADVYELHIDSEMDLLYAVTGTSTISLFGETITGRDALTITPEMVLDDLPEILEQALRKYEAKLPLQFDWVDNINKVKNDETIAILELELDDNLSNPSRPSTIWIGEPEIVDWEGHAGYSFEKNKRSGRHPVLKLSHLKDYLSEHNLELTVNALKNIDVHVNDADYHSIKSWSAYRCIYAEISVGEERYILRNGIWYFINQDFVAKIDAYLADVKIYEHSLPTYFHDCESDYNIDASASDSSIELMDKKNIPIGGPYDKVEFCDLIKDRTDLIHVKYYRSSSTLSHLFAQGCVASEAFISDVDFRSRLNKRLPKKMMLSNPISRPDPQDYRIVFAIATDKNLPKDLPFFSKVTLKNSLKTLRALAFQVEIAKIDINSDLYLRKKFKPN